MKIIYPCMLLILALGSSNVFSESEHSVKLPSQDILPVKAMPDFSDIQTECVLKRKEPQSSYFKSIGLEYPAKQNRIGQEGWVVLSYDIINGKIENVSVLDSSPEDVFERSAIWNLKHAVLTKNAEDSQGCLFKHIFNIVN